MVRTLLIWGMVVGIVAGLLAFGSGGFVEQLGHLVAGGLQLFDSGLDLGNGAVLADASTRKGSIEVQVPAHWAFGCGEVQSLGR